MYIDTLQETAICLKAQSVGPYLLNNVQYDCHNRTDDTLPFFFWVETAHSIIDIFDFPLSLITCTHYWTIFQFIEGKAPLDVACHFQSGCYGHKYKVKHTKTA